MTAVHDLVEFFAELEALAAKYKGVLAAREHFGGARELLAEHKEGRKRKLKDPNAPKRPTSAYICFSNDAREKLKKEHPELNNKEIMTTLGKMWADAPETEKKKYQKMSEKLREQYRLDKQEYERKKAAGELPPSPTSIAKRKLDDEHDELEPGKPKLEDDEEDDESSSDSDEDDDEDDEEKKKKKKNKAAKKARRK